MQKAAFLFLLITARAFAACDPPHGFPISEQRYGTACGYSGGAIAANDRGAFAAWHQADIGFAYVTGTNYGAPLDGIGRPRVVSEINYGGGTGRPRIATDGRDFLLVTYSQGFTDARLVRADGTSGAPTVLSDQGVGTFTSSGVLGNAAVVWTGSEYRVATTEIVPFGSGYHGHIRQATLTADGAPGIFSDIADAAALLALAPAGPGRALAIWTHGGVVLSAMTSASGLVSTPGPVEAIPPTASSVSLATDGTSFAAAYAMGSLVAAVRLGSPTPIVLDPNGTSAPQIVWDGNAYVVVWNDSANNIRMARLTASGVTPATTIGAGHVESAGASPNGVAVLHTVPCGAMAVLTIGGNDSILSIAPSPQTAPSLVATKFGHQVTWIENGTTLSTRFVSGSGGAGEVVALAEASGIKAASIPFEEGTAIVWGGSGAVSMARFDAFGTRTGETKTFPAPALVFSVSAATAGGDLFIVTSGQNDPFKGQVDATRTDGQGIAYEHVVLSNSGQDGFNALAGGDASRWLTAWRNGANEIHVVEMPHGDLRQQTRTALTLPTAGVAFLSDVVAGADPAIVWSDAKAAHVTFLAPRLDVILDASGRTFDARAAGPNVFWKSLHENVRLFSAPLSRVPSMPVERACLGLTHLPVEYDTRQGALSALAYIDGTRVLVRLPEPPRRRPSRH